MAYIETMTNLTNEAKTWYDRQLIDRAQVIVVYEQAAQKRRIPKRGGKQVEFRRFSPLAAATTALTEGTPPSGSNMTVTTVVATVSQYGDYVKGSDIVETQAIDPVLDELNDIQADQGALTRDVLTREILAAGTNVLYANGAGSRGDVGSGDWFDLTELRRMERLLSRNKGRPVQGNKFVVFCHTDTMTDFMGDSTVQNILMNAGARGDANPLFQGEVGKISRSVLVETPEGKVVDDGGEDSRDVYLTIGVAQNAYGVVELEAHTLQSTFVPAKADHADPLGQTWIKGWKMSFTAKILVQDWVVRLEHCTTYDG
jgi:N4-gp56 family major capsid protein